MNHIRNNIKDNFAQIPNTLINDNTLSDRARFIFCYMAAKSDDWKFYQDKMAKDLQMSVDTVRKYIAELLKSGWVTREEIRGERGVFDSFIYDLHPSPCRKNTESVKNGVGKNPSPLNSALTNTVPLQTKTINNKEENKVVEKEFSTVTLIDEVDETSVEIHHVPDYFDTEQKKPKEKSGAKKEKVKPDNPTPIKPMFEIYSDQYAKMNGGEKPEFMPKYLQPMKKLYGILEARQTQSSIVPLDKLQPWRDFIEMWGKYLQDHPKETYFTANFNPATFYSQFNTIVAKLKNQPMTTAQKWEQFYRENTRAQ